MKTTLKFVSNVFIQRTFFPGRGEKEKKRERGDVIHHCIDLVSHPFLLPPSPLSLFPLLNIYIQKKFVKLDKRSARKKESKYFFSFEKVEKKYGGK